MAHVAPPPHMIGPPPSSTLSVATGLATGLGGLGSAPTPSAPWAMTNLPPDAAALARVLDVYSLDAARWQGLFHNVWKLLDASDTAVVAQRKKSLAAAQEAAHLKAELKQLRDILHGGGVDCAAGTGVLAPSAAGRTKQSGGKAR